MSTLESHKSCEIYQTKNCFRKPQAKILLSSYFFLAPFPIGFGAFFRVFLEHVLQDCNFTFGIVKHYTHIEFFWVYQPILVYNHFIQPFLVWIFDVYLNHTFFESIIFPASRKYGCWVETCILKNFRWMFLMWSTYFWYRGVQANWLFTSESWSSLWDLISLKSLQDRMWNPNILHTFSEIAWMRISNWSSLSYPKLLPSRFKHKFIIIDNVA